MPGLTKEQRESRRRSFEESEITPGEVKSTPVANDSAVERTTYTTTRANETIRGIADRFKVHWRDIAEINLFKGKNGKYQMPFSTTRLKKGTGINLPCLRLNITKVMSIIQNLTEAIGIRSA